MASPMAVQCFVHSLGLVLFCAGSCRAMATGTRLETVGRDATLSPTEVSSGQGDIRDSGAVGVSQAKSESSPSSGHYPGKIRIVNQPRNGLATTTLRLRCPIHRCCRALRATRSAREERWSCKFDAASHAGASGNHSLAPSISWWKHSTDQQRPWKQELWNHCKGRYSGDCLSTNERGAVYACVITLSSGRDGPRTCPPYFFRVKKPAAAGARRRGCPGNLPCSMHSMALTTPAVPADPDSVDAFTSSPPPFPAAAAPGLPNTSADRSTASESGPTAATATAATATEASTGTSARLQADVTAARAPLFTNPQLGLVLARRGEALVLACSATGHPTPTISWLQGYTVLDSATSSGSSGVNQPEPVVRPNGSLHFASVSRSDEDVYRCVAENEHGQVVSQTNLYVL